jgi:hypothetical protein
VVRNGGYYEAGGNQPHRSSRIYEIPGTIPANDRVGLVTITTWPGIVATRHTTRLNSSAGPRGWVKTDCSAYFFMKLSGATRGPADLGMDFWGCRGSRLAGSAEDSGDTMMPRMRASRSSSSSKRVAESRETKTFR